MSEEKRTQLLTEGKIRDDGTRVEVCPLCLREFGPGEGLPVFEGDALGEAEALTVTTEAEV